LITSLRRPRDGLPPQVCKSRFGPDYRAAKVARKGSGYLLLPQPFPVLGFTAGWGWAKPKHRVLHRGAAPA
jgi:hypothetical protein